MAELSFKGFSDKTFGFFEELADNNEKAWFEAHRDTFETAVRTPMMALMAAAAEAFGGEVKLSRIHRDVRFSKDKSPYKTNLFGVIHSRSDPGAKQVKAAALYTAISAKGLYAGTGYYEMSADQLARYRAALNDTRKANALQRAMDEAKESLEVWGRSLKTAPKGFPRDHPRIELLRMKEIVAGRRFAPKSCKSAALKGKVFETWRTAFPVTDWLDRHVGPAELPEEDRFARR
ncbi:MAG: DUF2461 domain-containing protein [Pseudomonadota bacterium]